MNGQNLPHRCSRCGISLLCDASSVDGLGAADFVNSSKMVFIFRAKSQPPGSTEEPSYERLWQTPHAPRDQPNRSAAGLAGIASLSPYYCPRARAPKGLLVPELERGPRRVPARSRLQHHRTQPPSVRPAARQSRCRDYTCQSHACRSCMARGKLAGCMGAACRPAGLDYASGRRDVGHLPARGE